MHTRNEGNKRSVCTMCSVRVAILRIFCHIFRVAGMWRPKGLAYNNGGLLSSSVRFLIPAQDQFDAMQPLPLGLLSVTKKIGA